MKKSSLSTKEYFKSESSSHFGARAEVRSRKLKNISEEKLSETLTEVRRELDEGLSGAAEKIIRETLDNHSLSVEQQAELQRLLSFTLETQGRYAEALEIIAPLEYEEILSNLEPVTRIQVLTQIAISHSNQTDYPKAVALLKRARQEAEQTHLNYLLGSIYAGLARVYRKLNEFPISRDHASKALNYYREQGDWRGMAEGYYMIAATYHQEGNSEKSLEYFQQGIKIVGSRSASFLLGKIYSDMSGAYWFLRRPQEGIACLEKSIKFFEQTEHKIHSIAAYNNLGINLMLLGDWTKAESVIKRALELAFETNHVHLAGILDSLGEIKLLRGDLQEAQRLLERGVAFAKERKKEWYEIQALRNLARTLLAQGNLTEARAKAEETIEICRRIGERQISNMASLVLAEVFLQKEHFADCERELEAIEKTEPTSDFFVLGNIQRVRGLMALKHEDEELAVHHFSRALTIFETAEDLYHTALAHFLIGKNIADAQPERASKHVLAAAEIFRKLDVKPFLEESEEILGQLKKAEARKPSDAPAKRATTAGSQLLMLRLAEATASRELLFRELVAILQQESRSKKIVIAEMNDQKRFYPFITHGYVPNESMELVARYNEAHIKSEVEAFAKTKNLQIFQLRAPSATPAILIISPNSSAVLSDGSSIQPLLRVVELGMDVCALRDKDKSSVGEQETGAFTSNSLMPGFIHSSPAMTSLVEEVYKIRSSDVTVLVTGESGTGKELVSRAIHTISNRKDKVFVPFNCTAVPKELAEGHLFGYKKGAFTGAVVDSPGIIRAADGGTLFLDEVGDLPIDVQPKLLRFLQEGEVQPIGEKRPVKVDVRVIAATNMPLEAKVADGSFREDLYYRLNVIRLRVPPLRERRSEIPPIINYYVNHYASKFGRRDISVTPQTIDLLMVCEWEGNVRQLCNEIQRVVARAEDGDVITPANLSPELKRSATPIAFNESDNVRPIASYDKSFSSFNIGSDSGTLEEAVSELETQMINDSLRRHNWNISKVARELGLTRRGLYMKIARYGIEKSA
ncbi:MAG TPA: sigma 54-interacting transcriptional regulator [Pyrinomonadaceae bacterium]|jgi:DNA-binding NtrC family response regulator/tetratricopeptide (TPR) repeat protein